jgi:hypothetical protein
MNPGRTKIIACETVIEEMLPIIPQEMDYEVLDFGLHIDPPSLKTALQAAVDRVAPDYDSIILGYGMCSSAVVGLRSNESRLVIARVDDCIAIFLGSRQAYKQQSRGEPGTYYLTKGWIEVGDTPFSEFDIMVERYGQERAERMMKLLMKNYTRLAFIHTGRAEVDRYRSYSRDIAERFNLRYEEIQGSNSLVKKILYGPWDEDFIVVEPGEEVLYSHFLIDD